MTRTLRLVVAVVAALGLASAFDNKDFKKCSDLGFCVRNRALGESDARTPFVVDPASVKQSGDTLTADITNTAESTSFALTLRFFSSPDNTVHLHVEEKNIESKRFEVPFVLQHGDIRVSALETTITGEAATATSGDVRVVLSYNPFKCEAWKSGRLALVMNDRGLFNFEHYREKGEAPEAGMWEETFKGHTDSKPKGPASLGVDFTFVGASHVYGIPEHATDFALKPTRGEGAYEEPYRLYNLDVFEYSLDSPFGLYGSVPFMIGHTREGTSAVFILNSSEMYIDVNGPHTHATGKQSTNTHWFMESGNLDVFLMLGPSPADVTNQFTTLTGRPTLPPVFSLSYNQCRWNYKSEQDVAMVDGKFDEHDIPCDVLWLDIEHTDGKKYFTWDDKLFPTPHEMQSNLAVKGRKMVTIVDPHIKRDSGYHLHNKATEENLYVKTKEGKDFEGHCWPGASSYMDFLLESAREAYAKEYVAYEGATDSLHTWNDMNEPSVFNGPEMTMQKDLLHAGGEVEHRDLHNMYGMLHNMASYEGMLERLSGRRPFILTRSFFAGSQRIAGVWTGDNMARWDHLEAAQPMLLSLGMAGITHVGADVGGFFNNPDTELLVRWYQAGAYHPFFRAHAHIDTKRREPWLFGEPHTTHIRTAIRARYRLLPYWYTVARASNTTGAPIMRPLMFEFPDDPETFAMQDQFLVGPSVMVKPVTEAGVTESSVYLPGDQGWFDLETGEHFKGPGRVTVPSPMDKLPVFQRGGSVVAKRERARRSSSLMRHDPITLVVALDNTGTASGELYVDDGETFRFMEGESVHRRFTASSSSLTSTSLGSGHYEAGGSVAIERVIVRGLSGAPQAVTKTVAGETSELVFAWDRGQLVVRQPKVTVGQDWTISY